MASYIPVTPAGTLCTWLAADSEEKAWKRLVRDASHMPYGDQSAFEKRGYSVVYVEDIPPEEEEKSWLDL